jgi:MoxR-like ATPase
MSVDIAVLTEKIKEESSFVALLRNEMGKVIVGQAKMLDRLLIGLLARGHILLEGVPGLAKTLAISTLAKIIDTKFQRIQFTPDLLPADLVGTMIYNQKTGEFVPKKGPIFSNIILADEINRAPAKVQSALLEAMQERQVTIGDTTYPLTEPFLVLATQNPIEQEGTYPLPEAQLDRFLFDIRVGYPDEGEEIRILRETTGVAAAPLTPVVSAADASAMQRLAREVPAADAALGYAAQLVRATRPDARAAPDIVRRSVRWGAGPRAGQALILGAKAHALLAGRFAVSPADIRRVALPVLRHRVLISYAGDAEGVTPEHVIASVLDAVAPPASHIRA